MWTCDGTEFIVTTLQRFNVTLSTADNQYWRETSLRHEEG